MERKTHYKMYKAGKNWVFAMLSTVALTGVMAMSGNTYNSSRKSNKQRK
ncbi:KxYKxGKxW signal peptide domain-containing protein [Ligilactobacillus salivarius]